MLLAMLFAGSAFAQNPLSLGQFKTLSARHQIGIQQPQSCVHAPRKAASSVEDFVGGAVITSYSVAQDSVDFIGNSVDVTKVNDSTITITHLTPTATNAVKAIVNFENGTVSIPSGQLLQTDPEYGDIFIYATNPDNGKKLTTPVEGVIDAYGNISFTSMWGDYLTGKYENNVWTDWFYSSCIYHANAKMEVTDGKTGAVDSYNVVVQQADEKVQVLNFGNYGQFFVLIVNGNALTIESQMGLDMNNTASQGDYYSYSFKDDYSSLDNVIISGTVTEDALSFSHWTFWDEKSGQLTGFYGDTRIYYTDGSKFEIVTELDEPATPAAPSFSTTMNWSQWTENTASAGIFFLVPATDVEGNSLNTKKLYYQLYSDIEKDVKPIVLTNELYQFGADMTLIPYLFTDNDLVGHLDNYVSYGINRAVVLLDPAAKRYNKIGVKSVYIAGNETHESPVTWLDIKAYGTGIADVTSVDERSTTVYNLAGQPVRTASKGLYIVNGKKVMVR